jgi:hypothetical protein
MSTELQKLTLENCSIEYKHEDGTVTIFSYSGQPHDVIRELMERYMLPQKRYLEHPYHPDTPWWGNAAI